MTCSSKVSSSIPSSASQAHCASSSDPVCLSECLSLADWCSLSEAVPAHAQCRRSVSTIDMPYTRDIHAMQKQNTCEMHAAQRQHTRSTHTRCMRHECSISSLHAAQISANAQHACSTANISHLPLPDVLPQLLTSPLLNQEEVVAGLASHCHVDFPQPLRPAHGVSTPEASVPRDLTLQLRLTSEDWDSSQAWTPQRLPCVRACMRAYVRTCVRAFVGACVRLCKVRHVHAHRYACASSSHHV